MPGKKEINPTVDTTRFVNIDEDAFDIYINGELARHIESSEEDVMPVFVAQVGAKHLVDRILQKQGVADSNRPGPERDSLLARIIPDIADKIDIQPMSDEDYRASIDKKLKDQAETIFALGGKKDDKVSKLEQEVRMLKARMARKSK